jgi:hypothetical protein
MRRAKLLAGVAIAACALGSSVAAASEGNVSLVVGNRTLHDDDFWGDYATQEVFALAVDGGGSDWPVHLEAGLMASVKRKHYSTDTVRELYFGVQKIWDVGNMHPFAGGGLSAVKATIGEGFSVDDQSTGFYVHGGIWWRLGHRFNLGIDGRALAGSNLEFRNGFADTDADYFQIGVLAGFGWPPSK